MVMNRVASTEEIIAKWDGMNPRERDAWVAEVVTKEPRRRRQIPCPDGERGCAVCHYVYYPQYTTDISAAWAVLNAIPGEVYMYRGNIGSNFVVTFGSSGESCHECAEDYFEITTQAIAPTAPEAICLAGIIAKLAEATE